MDPRPAVVSSNLADVRRIVAVTGGKGGIGKSVVSATLALSLTRRATVGLLDLDLTSPCDHLILGADGAFPEERAGIVPPRIAGVSLMSVAFFSGAHATPLRGADVTNALVELLAITRWGELDVLVVDMPPGIGDAALDAVRLLGRAEHLVVATPSRVVIETVRRTLALLRRIDAPVLGVLENMRRDGDPATVGALAEDCGAPYLGAIPFDAELETATGHPERLARTGTAAAIARLADRLL